MGLWDTLTLLPPAPHVWPERPSCHLTPPLGQLDGVLAAAAGAALGEWGELWQHSVLALGWWWLGALGGARACYGGGWVCGEAGAEADKGQRSVLALRWWWLEALGGGRWSGVRVAGLGRTRGSVPSLHLGGGGAG